jgi:hypothetical protein
MTGSNGSGDAPIAQLIKVLGMLGSSFDHEALVAARKAYTLLVANDWTWEQLLANGSASTLTQAQLQKVYSAGLQRGEAVGYQRGMTDAAVLAPQGPSPKTELGDAIAWAERVLDAASKAEADGQLTDFEVEFSTSRREAIKRFGRRAYVSQRQFDAMKRLEQSLRRRRYL